MHIVDTLGCDHEHTTILALEPREMHLIQQALYSHTRYRQEWWENKGKNTKQEGIDFHDPNFYEVLQTLQMLGAWSVAMQDANQLCMDLESDEEED